MANVHAIGTSARLVMPPVRAAAVLLVVGLLSRAAPAAPISYGNHMGTHVTYVAVTETDISADPVPLFGPPSVTGDSMDFNPIGFDAESTGAGSDDTAASLDFMVTAKSGSRIGRVSLNEAGNTTLGGNVTPGSMGTGSSVVAGGTLLIQEVDFATITPISVPFALTFSPSGGTYFLGTDGGGGALFNTQWTGSVTLDINAILVANGFVLAPGPLDPNSGATKVSIDLDNTLETDSEAGTSAAHRQERCERRHPPQQRPLRTRRRPRDPRTRLLRVGLPRRSRTVHATPGTRLKIGRSVFVLSANIECRTSNAEARKPSP